MSSRKIDNACAETGEQPTALLCRLLNQHSKKDTARLLGMSPSNLEYHLMLYDIRIARVAVPPGHRIYVKKNAAHAR